MLAIQCCSAREGKARRCQEKQWASQLTNWRWCCSWAPCCSWLLSSRGFGFNVVRNLRQSHTKRVRKWQPCDDAAGFPDQRDCRRALYLVILICLWELFLPHKSHRKSLKILPQKATVFSFSVKRSRARNSFLQVSARTAHFWGRSECSPALRSETCKKSNVLYD